MKRSRESRIGVPASGDGTGGWASGSAISALDSRARSAAGSRHDPGLGSSLRGWAFRSVASAALCLGAGLVWAGGARAQYTIPAPSGDTALTYPPDTIVSLLERSRELYDVLQQDPEILYYVGYGPDAPASAPEGAYPWNAVRVESDSVVRVVTPENLREADRAYYNYAVIRMRERSDSVAAGDCGGLVEREARILSAFVDGWIVSRAAYGAAPYPPLDELPFVRRANLLPAFVVTHGAPALGECEDRWSLEHPDALAEYADLRRRLRDGTGAAGSPSGQ